MTVNPKPDAVTAEEMFKLIEQLSSQIGDDIQVIFNHEALFKRSRAALVYQSAEITRLRAELATADDRAKDAHAVGFAAGIEAALAAAVDYTPEKHSGLTLASHVTGKNIQNAIRALTPPDITAAAARVLLAAWPTDTSFDAAFAACATAYHGGDQMQDTMDRTLATVSAALRALAEVKL